MKNDFSKTGLKVLLKLLVILIFLNLPTIVSAQTSALDWQYCFGSSYSNFPGNMCKTDGGGYIMTGAYQALGGDFTNFYGGIDIGAIKIDASGQKIWSKNFGDGGTEFSYGIIKGSQGKYYILGYTLSTSLPNSHSTSTPPFMADGYVICIDSTGNLIWQRCYGGFGEEDIITAVLMDGYLYAAGLSSKSKGGDTGPNYDPDTTIVRYDVFVYKINLSNGNLIRAKGFGGKKNDKVNKIIATKDHKLLLVGSSMSIDYDVPLNYGQTDAWALKIDTGLNVISSKIWGGSGNDEFSNVINLSNNDFMFYGITYNRDTLIGNLHVVMKPNMYPQLMIIKTDSNFNEIWQKGYGCKVMAISQNYGSSNFIETLDHGFIMGAKANYYKCEPEPFDEGQSMFIKVDSTGQEVFTRYYGNKQTCDVRSINETKDGSIVVYDMGIRDTNNICKRPDVHSTFWNVYQWSYGLNIGVEEKDINKDVFLVYPNPTNNRITFETAVDKLQLQVYNISGQLLTDKKLQIGSNTLDVSNLPQGMYFYRLTDDDKYFKSGKFVKE